MKKDETSCPSFEEWVEAHHEGGEALDRLRAHGRECPPCAEAARVAALLAEELGPSDLAPPVGMHGRIMGRLRRAAWTEPRAWAHRLRRLLLPVTVTATATAFVLLAFVTPAEPPALSALPATHGDPAASGPSPSALHLACLWGRVEAGAAGGWRSVDRDGELAPETAVRVAEGARAVLRQGASCTVLLEGPCLYRPDVHGGRLTRGHASFSVRPGSAPFAVATPAGRVAVLGTRFAVHVAETGRMTVRVDEGRVAVEAAGTRREIAAGESWPGPASVASSPESPDGSPGGAGMTGSEGSGTGQGEAARSVPSPGRTTDEEGGTRLPTGEVPGRVGDGGPHTVREGF